MSPPEVWGPAVWTLFHTLIEKMNPDAYPFVIGSMFRIITRICQYLPCPDCSRDASNFLAKINLNDYKTKNDFKNMLYLFHNWVNAKKRKPLYNYINMDKYALLDLRYVINNFISKYNTKGNMKLLSESFQRNFVIRDFFSWFRANNRAFVNPTPQKTNSPVVEEKTVEEEKTVVEPVIEQPAVVEEKVVEEPVIEPVVEQAEEPLVEPAVEEPAVEPVEEPAEEPAVEPAVEPVVESVEEPAIEPAIEPAEEQVVVEPAVESVEEPAVEPAVEPVVEPAVEPAVEQAVEEPAVVEPAVEEEKVVEEPAVEAPAVEEAPIVEEATV